MQLSALLNHHNREVDTEVVRVANAMRKEQQTVNADETRRIFEMYYSEIDPWAQLPVKFVNAVPPEEHVETFHWLFDKVRLDDSKSVERSYYLAVLEDVAGRRTKLWRRIAACNRRSRKAQSARRWTRGSSGCPRIPSKCLITSQADST